MSQRGLLLEARRSKRKLLFATFAFSVIVNLLMLTGPLFMLQVYDRVLGSRSEETLSALFFLVALIYMFMAVIDYARGRVLARYGANLLDTIEAAIFQQTINSSVDAKARTNPNSSLRDLEAVRTFFNSPTLLAIMDLPWVPLYIGLIFIFHIMIGWIAVAGMVVLIVLPLANHFFTSEANKDAQKSSGQAHATAEESRRASEIVVGQGMLEAAEARWKGANRDGVKKTVKVSDISGGFTTFTKTFRLFLQSAVLAVGAYFVLQGELTSGAMIAGSILMGRALAPIEQVMAQWPVIQRTQTSFKKVEKVLDTMPSDGEIMALPRPAAHLVAQNVLVAPLGSKTATLRGISFELKPGEGLGVIGRSGAGKSSLARAILGLWPVLSGEIRLGSATLNQYSHRDLGRYIGYLPQTVTMFTGTIRDNIARLDLEPDDEAVIKAAKMAEVHDLILSLPDGYDTLLAGDNAELSGGQKQRIGLARALYGSPVLLLLDEPNSALDSEGSVAMNKAVQAFKAGGGAVIIMTHRPGAISECDTLLVLDKGQVATYGPRDEVLAKTMQNADKIAKAAAAKQASKMVRNTQNVG